MSIRGIGAGVLLVAVVATGCGTTAASHESLRVARNAGAPAAQPAHPAKAVVPASPHLLVAVRPASGAAGTVVHVTATGCVDATGVNHAASFNAGDRSAGHNPNAVRALASTLSGTTLTATYTVRSADRGSGHGTFYVQCGASLASAPFVVTR
jgi:hypothetical protein